MPRAQTMYRLGTGIVDAFTLLTDSNHLLRDDLDARVSTWRALDAAEDFPSARSRLEHGVEPANQITPSVLEDATAEIRILSGRTLDPYG